MISTSISIDSIDRRPGISREEFFDSYLNPGIPVIIPGAMKEWKAHEKWNPQYLRDTYGDKVVRVMGSTMKLRDFIETILVADENNPSKYLNEVNIHKEFPELLEDITPMLNYALPDRLMTRFMPESWGMRNGVVELLIAGKGTKFPFIHYDGYHMNTFVTQIRGDKEFILFAPDQTPFMYQAAPRSNKSLVNDVDHPDLAKFPLFAKAKSLRSTVYQGETVFLPTGWWHTTRLLSLSIAVSTNNINPRQWNNFVDDFTPGLSQSKLKQSVYKSYLRLAGKAMDLTGN